jgi:hypothetical protein
VPKSGSLRHSAGIRNSQATLDLTTLS